MAKKTFGSSLLTYILQQVHILDRERSSVARRLGFWRLCDSHSRRMSAPPAHVTRVAVATTPSGELVLVATLATRKQTQVRLPSAAATYWKRPALPRSRTEECCMPDEISGITVCTPSPRYSALEEFSRAR